MTAATAASLLTSEAASACSELPHVVEASYPRFGDTDVPTNAVLFLAGELVDQADVRLETVAGENVPIRLAPALPIGFDVTPTEALEPHQSYVLRAADPSLEYPDAATGVEFSTGEGPAIAHPLLRAPVLANATMLTIPSPCTNQRLCMVPENLEALLFISNGPIILQESAPGELRSIWGGIGPLTHGCMIAQFRDFLGNRSPSAELCEGDVREVSFNSIPVEPVTCAAFPEPMDDALGSDGSSVADGCALTFNSVQQPGATSRIGWGASQTLGMFAALLPLLYRRSRVMRWPYRSVWRRLQWPNSAVHAARVGRG
jgi:hypothetical protein